MVEDINDMKHALANVKKQTRKTKRIGGITI